MAFCALGLLVSAAACSAGGDEDATLRPAMTNATTNERNNATGVGNTTSPGAGTSSGTTNTGASDPGTTNTVPAMGRPVGAAADEGVDVGASGPATSGGSLSGADDGDVADAGADAGDAGQADAGQNIADEGEDGGEEADAGAPVADAGLADAGVNVAEALADGQIIAVVDVLNASEVEQAQSALPRLQNDAVRAFAQIMIEEHQAARDGLGALATEQQIVAANSELADQLRAQSQQVQNEIGATDAAQLDAVYLDAQIRAHAEAEALLDDLSAAADSQALATRLSELRLNVLGHLQSASALRASLQL